MSSTPPQTAAGRGQIRQKVQIPLCRHRLRCNMCTWGGWGGGEGVLDDMVQNLDPKILS